MVGDAWGGAEGEQMIAGRVGMGLEVQEGRACVNGESFAGRAAGGGIEDELPFSGSDPAPPKCFRISLPDGIGEVLWLAALCGSQGDIRTNEVARGKRRGVSEMVVRRRGDERWYEQRSQQKENYIPLKRGEKKRLQNDQVTHGEQAFK